MDMPDRHSGSSNAFNCNECNDYPISSPEVFEMLVQL